jgi:hypothetical protein
MHDAIESAVSLEKRRQPRLSIELTAHCRIGDRHLRETLADISLTGLFLKTPSAAEPGSQVRIALALPYVDGPRFCTLVGNVVRTEGQGVAVEFDGEMDRFDRELLKGFLSLWGARRVGRA